jgi:intracellular multiplication protein IcmP
MSNGNQDSGLWGIALIAGLLYGLWWVTWHYGSAQIMDVLRWIKVGELWIVDLVSSNPNLGRWRALLIGASAYGVPHTAGAYPLTMPMIEGASDLVGQYLRWPFVAIMAGMLAWLVVKAPGSNFLNKFDLEGLIKAQAKTWPVISPIIHFKPAETSARVPGDTLPEKLPFFAESLTPEEWVAYNRIPVQNGIPDKDEVRRLCTLQLGPRWSKNLNFVQRQPLYIQALIAAFALKGVQKRQQSDDFLGEIAKYWTPAGGLVLPAKIQSEIAAILNDPAVGGKALALSAAYAYRTTALLGILRWARDMGGVLAPSQFLWLRGFDRALWYPLNNLGRRSYHAEAAGAMAHFMAENEAKKPLPVPRVETAVATVAEYFATVKPTLPAVEGGAKNAGQSGPKKGTLALRQTGAIEKA